MDINEKLNDLQLGHASSDESVIADVSTDVLRKELARRVELAKAQKQNRIKDLQDIIQKSTAELRQLMGETTVGPNRNKSQKQLDGLPSVVKAMMPKELKDSMEHGTPDQIQQIRPKSSQPPKEVKRCQGCGATSSNWEFSPNDNNTYCVCGELVIEGASQ